MLVNTFARTHNFSPSYMIRASVGFGLALIISFAGSASAARAAFGYADGLGGADSDTGSAVAVDAWDNVYTAAFFSDTINFDPGVGMANLTSVNNNGKFAGNHNSAGNSMLAKAMGNGQWPSMRNRG